ncbi:hypothetical protein AB1Y20_022426 [Prymnesium parvum]|uniref:TORTIFOLIA1/SINE1-2 N-terminal domain-containing protein n=1 Tax=Prymnesium parvum TaxID=97485 RepID=A0AB34JGW0_PRYPA
MGITPASAETVNPDLLAELCGLIAALGDSARAGRASAQLSTLLANGAAPALLETLLPRLLGPEGVRSTGGQRLVAKHLSEATQHLGVDALCHLPRIVEVTTLALGDGEASVREAFSTALAEAARNTSYSATGKELLTLLFRPLLRLLEKPNRPLQLGVAQALREVIRALHPAQLRPALPSIINAVRKHLKSLGTHGRPALLDCASSLVHSLPESFTPFAPSVLPLALQGAMGTDWHERLAAVSVLENLATSGVELSAPQRAQLDECLKMLKYDKVSVVRVAAVKAQEHTAPLRPAAAPAAENAAAAAAAATAALASFARTSSSCGSLESVPQQLAPSPPAASFSGWQASLHTLLAAHEHTQLARCYEAYAALAPLDRRLSRLQHAVRLLRSRRAPPSPPSSRPSPPPQPAPDASPPSPRPPPSFLPSPPFRTSPPPQPAPPSPRSSLPSPTPRLADGETGRRGPPPPEWASPCLAHASRLASPPASPAVPAMPAMPRGASCEHAVGSLTPSRIPRLRRGASTPAASAGGRVERAGAPPPARGEAAEGGAWMGAGFAHDRASAIYERLRQGGGAGSSGAAVAWLAQEPEGREHEALSLAVKVMSHDADEGRKLVLRLWEESNPHALREMPSETATPMVTLLVSELSEGHHVATALRWLEEVLHERLQGRNLVQKDAVAQLSRTLRTLSASSDATGVGAAKALALLGEWKDNPFEAVTEPWVGLD